MKPEEILVGHVYEGKMGQKATVTRIGGASLDYRSDSYGSAECAIKHFAIWAQKDVTEHKETV